MEPTTLELVSNALSTVTILSCFFLKVPQIINTLQKKTAEGIYVQSLLMELFGYTTMTLYNYRSGHAALTYLEYPVIAAQVLALLWLALRLSGRLRHPALPVLAALYIAVVAGFATGLLPKDILDYLVPLCTPLSGCAKIGYIVGIVRSGDAGAVAAATWLLSALTNLARVFTVWVDSADWKLLVNFTVSAALSGAVLATALLYRAAPRRRKRH